MLTKSQVTTFLYDEDGAATIDFVVMTAAGVAMTVAATNAVRDVMSDMVDGISISAAAVSTSTSFGGGEPANGEGG